MTHNNITLIAFAVTALGCVFTVDAQVAYNPIDTIDVLKKERAAQYNDSLINALYPHPEIKILDEEHVVQEESVKNKIVAGNKLSAPKFASISTDKAVGEITINSGTSPSGAKTYDVPITVNPGMGGFTPQMGLSYNSQRGNSTLGMGWSISGLPIITRGGKTIYYDDKTEGVVSDNSDTFTLDGVRLIKISEASDHIMYESEHGNIKVKGYIGGTFMRYFEVYFPDGTKGVFGNKESSWNFRNYPIVSYQDTYGNEIKYEYIYNNALYAISKISYNGCSIEFSYDDSRPDPLLSYYLGAKEYEPKLLKGIVLKLGTVITGRYSLTYDTRYNKSLLSRIDYSVGNDNAPCNPLLFYYGDDDVASSFSQSSIQLRKWYTALKPSAIKAVKGKFDFFNGSEGIITYPNKNPYWKVTNEETPFKFQNVYSSSDTLLIYPNLSIGVASPYSLRAGDGFADIFCADIKGIQEDYIIKINNNVIDGDDNIIFDVYRSSPYSEISFFCTRTFCAHTLLYRDGVGNVSVQPKYYYSGDFNGDGKMEILVVSAHNPFPGKEYQSKCYLYDLDGDKELYVGHVFPYKVEFVGDQQADFDFVDRNTDIVLVMDYDGDGKSDICHICEDGLTVYTFDVSDKTYTPTVLTTDKTIKRGDLFKRSVLPSDYNGDGLTDILVSPVETDNGSDKTWRLYSSKGRGGFDLSTFECTAKSSSENEGFIAQDVNGDGMCDLVKYTSSNFMTFISEGDKLGVETATTGLDSTNSNFIPTNVSSRGSFTQLICLKDGKAVKFTFSRDDNMESMMTGMVNSHGFVENNTYGLIDKSGERSNIYARGYGAVYPYVNILEPLCVVSNIRTYVNEQQLDIKRFKYHNAVIHRHGLGFCGFEKITTTDNRGECSTQIYAPYQRGVLLQETTREFDKNYTYSFDVAQNKTVKVKIVKKVEKDLLKNTSVTTGLTYDSYGFPTKEISDYGDNIAITKTYEYTYQPKVGAGYCIGLKTSQSKTVENAGESYTEKIKVTYNSNLKRIAEYLQKNGKTEKTMRYSYDSRGNVICRGYKPYTIPTYYDSIFEYDGYGRVIKATSPLGLKSSYTYDATGRVSTVTDCRGGVIRYEYDKSGNPVKITNPDNTVKEYRYSWNTSGENALYSIVTESTGKPTVTTEYDAFNREVRTSEVRFDGLLMNTDKVYDRYGNMIKQSVAVKNSADALWNEYNYDIHGRILSELTPAGKLTKYSYNGLEETVVADNVSTTKKYNVLGHLVSVTDPAGTVSYDVAVDGQPVRILAVPTGGYTCTQFAYDDYRRRTRMTDQSIGSTEYVYNPVGNLWKEINAENDTIYYSYDLYNRLSQKKYNGLTISYKYDSYGEISSISADNGTSKSFEYDEYGRLSELKESGPDGVWLKKYYNYSDGNISRVSYESNRGRLADEFYFYENGHLTENHIDTRASYRLLGENRFGQPTEVITGRVLRKYTYDEYGMLVGRSAETEDVKYQNFSYEYDYATGNLLSRCDSINGITETFDYDNLNRLTSYGDETATYSNIGNITQKSDVGTLNYAITSNPYRLVSANVSNEAFPLCNQAVTYTSYMRPATITENGVTATFMYNADLDRVKMLVSKGEKQLSRYYLGDCYEFEVSETGEEVEKLYLMGDYYKSPIVLLKYENFMDTCHILRDNIGSITHVVSTLENYGLAEVLSYDAWGRLRNPETHELYGPDDMPAMLIGRGYTGHEHLPWFGLVNMNARLYDPAVSRFLSPDPYVQMPENSQNFNRYSYALNNPFKYTDPDGEFFFFTIFNAITDFWGNMINHGLNFGKYNWKRTRNAWKIDIGMFKGNFMQVLNKWTWGLGSSVVGYYTAQLYNTATLIDKVTDSNGMLALSGATGSGNAAFTIGHYSFGPKNYVADWRDHLFVHEYGHYIQSQRMGFFYFPIVAIPSLASAAFTSDLSGGMKHSQRWFEVDASYLGAKYFDKKYGRGKEEYTSNSPDYFDIESFRQGSPSSYYNMRLSIKNGIETTNSRRYPTSGANVLVWDFFLL